MNSFGMYNQVMVGDRYNFYAATQQPNEEFTQFAARLCALAAKCNFDNVEEELHYRFVMGMLPGPERSLLFTVELSQPLSFASALEFVEGIKYTRGATTEWVTPLKTACEKTPEQCDSYTTRQGIIMRYDKKSDRYSTPKSKYFTCKGHSKPILKVSFFNG